MSGSDSEHDKKTFSVMNKKIGPNGRDNHNNATRFFDLYSQSVQGNLDGIPHAVADRHSFFSGTITA